MGNRTLLCSSGALIGRANGFDITLVSRILPSLIDEGVIDGAELMMLPVYYGRLREVAQLWLDAGISFPVIHCEKEVGTLLSDAAAAAAAGETEQAVSMRRTAVENFRLNCEMGALAASHSMVLHLWGGKNSDSHIEDNAAVLPQLLEIIRPYGIRLLIENVPSTTYDPLSNWHRLLPYMDACSLIFDTRFGQLHRQIDETWEDREIVPHIRHIHISDIQGAPRDFATLRPILHPGEGMIDFSAFAAILDRSGYSGTITLESPVIRAGGADADKLRRTLTALRTLLIEHTPCPYPARDVLTN